MSASPSHADMIEIPTKKEGCIERRRRAPVGSSRTSRSRRPLNLPPVKPGNLSEYYNYAPFKFIYNENKDGSVKPHHFNFNIALITSDNTIIINRPLTYLNFRIKNNRDNEHFATMLNSLVGSNNIKDWFLPLMDTIKSKYEMNMLSAIINAIQLNTTEKGKTVSKPSNIDNTITMLPGIYKNRNRKLIELTDKMITSYLSGKETSMHYNIYFAFKMKPGFEDYTVKRILQKICVKNPDGTEHIHYMQQTPSGEYISTGGIYTTEELSFMLGGKRRTARRTRRKETRRSRMRA